MSSSWRVALRRRPISRELLANLIYGPSMVSLESVLSYHGLICCASTPPNWKRWRRPPPRPKSRFAPVCCGAGGMGNEQSRGLHAVQVPTANRPGTVHRNQAIRIKLEVDTDPPPRFGTDTRFLLAPIPFSVRTFDLPSFLAGKMHALLCREWGGRVKGRDWYDFVWHLGQGTALNLPHLEARLRQTGHYQGQTPLTLAEVKQMLHHRIEQLDIEAAKRDVERFLTDPAAIKVWSRDFFTALSEKLERG